MKKYFVGFISATVLMLPAGFLLGIWADSGSDRVITKTVTVEVPISRVDTSTKACIDNHGVPTYSAWDGGLNGCIYVGQSSKDSNVELKR